MSRMGDTGSGDTGKGQGGQANIGETATQVGQNIREMGTQVRDMATERYGQLRDQAQNYYQQGRERATEWEQSLEPVAQLHGATSCLTVQAHKKCRPCKRKDGSWIGARGRNRTGTTAKSRDFLTTSTFAANAHALFVVWSTPSP